MIEMRPRMLAAGILICACIFGVTPGFDCYQAAAAVMHTQVQGVPANAGMSAVGASLANTRGFSAAPFIGLQGPSLPGTIKPNAPVPQSPVVFQADLSNPIAARLLAAPETTPAAMAGRASVQRPTLDSVERVSSSLKDTREQARKDGLDQLYDNGKESREPVSGETIHPDESVQATDSPAHLAKTAASSVTSEKSVLPLPAPDAPGKTQKWIAPIRKIAAWISSRFGIVRWVSFTPTGPGHFYHGTSWDNLVNIALSGGDLKPEISFFALKPRVSKTYARTKALEQNSKAILLEFQDQPTRPLVVHWLNYYGLQKPRGLIPFIPLDDYYFAIKPIPLAFLTEASKRAVLAELRSLAETSDRQAYDKLSQAFTRAFGETQSLSQ